MDIRLKAKQRAQELDREAVELMVVQVLKIAEDIGLAWEVDPRSPALRQGLQELAAHLECLKRYCEGKE